MQIILASAKIMNDKLKSIPDVSLSTPRFQNEAESFARDMAQYSTETIAEMLGCSHQIAAQNRLRFMQFFDEKPKLPAILAYHGQAYKHLKAAIKREQSDACINSAEREQARLKAKAETLTVDDLNYSQGKLWITSFLYGLLRPLDGILPYRMEGNVELLSGDGQNMFGFWKSRLTDVLIDSVKAVWAKTCRGAMTRFIIENRIDKPEDLCAFSYEGFTYEPKLGGPDFPHFIKQ